jgi:hypothetical protein
VTIVENTGQSTCIPLSVSLQTHASDRILDLSVQRYENTEGVPRVMPKNSVLLICPIPSAVVRRSVRWVCIKRSAVNWFLSLRHTVFMGKAYTGENAEVNSDNTVLR